MSKLGTPLQAIVFAATLGDDAGSFAKSWVAMDREAISEAWPGYEAFIIKETSNDWWGKIDDQIIDDTLSDAISNGEGDIHARDVKEALSGCGLKIVPDIKISSADVGALAQGLDIDREQLDATLVACGLMLMAAEVVRKDGRTAHYGDGEQPWDTCLPLGWAQYGAAFSILRYLRRSKTPERDLAAAKVYLGWLYELAQLDKDNVWKLKTDYAGSLTVFRVLIRQVLTDAECERLGVTFDQRNY